MKNKILLNTVKGLNKKTAEFLFKCSFTNYRIVKEDNNFSMLTMDVNPDRMNLIIEKGKIKDAYFG
jgi:hypothetical protein